MVRMDPLTMQAVKAIAVERAMARNAGRIDSSEIIREAVEFWLQRKGR